MGLSIQEGEYHLNDEVTLLKENPDIFRKALPIRARRGEPEEVEERKSKICFQQYGK